MIDSVIDYSFDWSQDDYVTITDKKSEYSRNVHTMSIVYRLDFGEDRRGVLEAGVHHGYGIPMGNQNILIAFT